MIAALLLAAAVQLPSAAPTGPGERQLLAWVPGPVTCDRVPMMAIAMRRPLIGLAWPGSREGIGPVTYRFRIDATGRPLSITRDGTGYVAQGEDIAPSLAASRFSVNSAQGECAITYRPTLSPLATAPVADLIAYSVTPTGGPLPGVGWNRINPTGGTCRDEPQPRTLRRVLPDPLALPATPGAGSWSMTGYDLDTRGRPIHVRTVAGTANAVLDAAAVTATKASRFTRGARTGCLYPLRRSAGTLLAPVIPDRVGTLATTGHCPMGDAWAYYPPPVYPEPWRRHAIEGWAVIGFDVAPWGELGNLRVIASEPAADFGTEAMRLLRGARKPASATGASGCVDRVRFVMRPQARPDETASPVAG